MDGRANTTALAANEWPWTYEVDLLEPHPVRRVKVSFVADGYTTKLQIALSADRKTWQTVASADNLDGQPYTREFEPVRAHFVRVSALKPMARTRKARRWLWRNWKSTNEPDGEQFADPGHSPTLSETNPLPPTAGS